jgi:hypothetical protein
MQGVPTGQRPAEPHSPGALGAHALRPAAGPQTNARGVTKRGGCILTGAHVERILTDTSGRASGVALRGGGTVTARRAVVTNASAWDTLGMLPPGTGPAGAVEKMAAAAGTMEPCPSFMHLHVGFDATGGWPTRWPFLGLGRGLSGAQHQGKGPMLENTVQP